MYSCVECALLFGGLLRLYKMYARKISKAKTSIPTKTYRTYAAIEY